MIAALDNTFLTLILNPEAKATPDPSTKLPTPDLRLKLLSLLDDLSSEGARLIVPTTAIGEALCVATPADELISRLNAFTCIDPQGFGMRAAIDMSDVIKKNLKEIKQIRSEASLRWQHVKMDFTIVGVALACGASHLYTDDKGQAEFAKLAGLQVKHTWQLEVTGKHRQQDLDLGARNDSE